MRNDKETPEETRERLRQEELKKSSSSIHGGGLSDLVGGLGWKGTGILILLLIIAGVIVLLFVK
ncbi:MULTISPECIES: DUF6366 family protein [Oceanobacillus]|uniref:DUF6366 family protein n=1 Tax=Oceanobacillus TaxID=182709 RepID=UPI0021165161|nr:DUF6366 family protein [Oceanobacillus oncorhynchi]MDM8101675.1 DUF6366 family protein [Oceanobacillus oncorhynchi]UUI41328.1 DUF6366 family protein [Oceanobacillus oncorhynchi]